MRPIAPEEILELIGQADRIEIVNEICSIEATWFTGSPEEEEKDEVALDDSVVIDNDKEVGACVTVDELRGALLLDDNSVRLADNRAVIFYGVIKPQIRPDVRKAMFSLVVGDNWCKYSYDLEVSSDYSIDSLVKALAVAVNGKVSEGKLVELTHRDTATTPAMSPGNMPGKTG